VKCVIDEVSLAFFQENINNISTTDPAEAALARMTIWLYMNEMVRDGKLKLIPYCQTALNQLSNETEDAIYDFQLRFLTQATGFYLPMNQRSFIQS
jgi:hypothetical protein